MQIIADKLGLELEFVQMDFDLIIAALNSGQIDAGMSCFTFDAKRKVIFSTPYLMSAQAIVVPADSEIAKAEDLKNKKVIAGLGTTGEKAVQEIEGVDVISPDDYLVGFQMLASGQGDAVVCDYGVGLKYAAKDEFKMLEETLQKEEMSVIIKSGNTKIEEAINKAIEEFKQTEEYTALVEKWELD
jgi:polar amino acid transport system substrate-binding protein